MNLKRLIIPFLLTLCLSFDASAQFKGRLQEVGVFLGASQFFGELGGASRIGRPFVADMELALTRPAIGGFYRYNLTSHWGVRGNLIWGIVKGDDGLIYPRELGADEWFRYFRNLSFRSGIVEFSAQVEFNFLRYEPRRKRFRFSPYVFLGLGGFYYNPKAKVDDDFDPDTKDVWVPLRPLGTEGQGTAEFPDRLPYSQISISFPMGFGIKYAINRYWNLGFEIGHRPTNSDYIDDVSTIYVAEEVFYNNNPNDPDRARLAYHLSRRSAEIVPNSYQLAYITSQGSQRGDPLSYDHYTFVGAIVVIFNITGGRVICPKF